MRIALTPLEKNGDQAMKRKGGPEEKGGHSNGVVAPIVVAPPWAGGMLCGCISVIYRYHCPGRVELAAPAPPRGCCTGLSVGRT